MCVFINNAGTACEKQAVWKEQSWKLQGFISAEFVLKILHLNLYLKHYILPIDIELILLKELVELTN